MQKRFLPALSAAAFSLIIIGFSCTKIDTTTLGGDVVTIDNVNTFADTLAIDASQGIFLNDSTMVGKADNYVIGKITTDPLFGTTEAAVYVQFKPIFYPYYFGNAGDTVRNINGAAAGLDSMVLCLSFKGTWGDSSVSAVPQTFTVKSINDADFRDKTDTVRKLNYQPAVDPAVLGSVIITPQTVKQKVYLAGKRDSVDNQIRIKLNTAAGVAFANSLYNNQDSTAAGPNNAYYNDSIFRNRYNGFAVTVSGPGNTLYYVNLADLKSRLEIHYHKTKNGVHDTTYQTFQMYTTPIGTAKASSGADYVKRDYTGSPVVSPSSNDIFLQTSPGTYANLKVPGLTGYSNRIVHRAFLIVEQTPDVPSSNIFTPPPYLYLDLKDTSTAVPQRYKPVYFDLSTVYPYNPDATDLNSLYHPYPYSNVDVSNFGGSAMERADGTGTYYRYEINITRYVQHIVSNGYHNYDMRLYAPYNYYYPQYLGTQYVIPFYNPLALGRVRVGSGTNPVHKMKLVVIYSKI